MTELNLTRQFDAAPEKVFESGILHLACLP